MKNLTAAALLQPVMATAIAAAIATGVLTVSGCARQAPLTHTLESPEAVARAVLDGLARRDRAALDALMMTRAEFDAHLWPSLPASRPETNMRADFVWNRLKHQSDARLAHTLAQHGGKSLILVGVELRGTRSSHGALSVTRDSIVTVRAPTGQVQQLRLFGSVVQQGQRYKVLSYVTD